MLKLHDKLWYVKTKSNYHKNDPDLAYMTYYEENAAFRKRQHTGTRWAQAKDEDGIVVDNELLPGFKVDSVVSRWTTENKLFRVRDPRGFIVEVPTGNIANVLSETTVVNGVIQTECMWGRQNNSHLLIPKDSVPYQEAMLNMQKLDKSKTVSIKDIAIGEIIEVTSYGSTQKCVYLGQYKATHEGEIFKRSSRWGWGNRSSNDVLGTVGEHTDTKWWLATAGMHSLERLDSNGYVGINHSRKLNITSRTGQTIDRDIVNQLRDKLSYADSQEARKEFRKRIETQHAPHTMIRNDGRIEEKFIGAEWRE